MSDIHEIENELRDVLGPKIQCDLERMFPKRKGLFARGRVKRKLKLLKNLAPSLATALVDGEKLIYVARANAMFWVYQILSHGTFGQGASVTCAVLTDRRILLIDTNHAGKQRLFRNQLPYMEIAQVKIRSFRTSASTLKFKDGTRLVIDGFQATDRKYMQQYVPELVSSMPDGVPPLGTSIQCLCPRCPAIYLVLQTECKNCGTTFKSPQKAALMSLFLPGLGDLYLGYTTHGVVKLVGSVIEWAVLVRITISLVSGEEGAVRFLFGWIVIMGVTNVIAFFLTRVMGRRGLIAEKGTTRGTFGASIADLQSSNAD